MSDQDRSRKEAAHDLPARGSKWVWIVGAIFLLIVIFLLIRGVVYASNDGPVGTGVSDATQDSTVVTNNTN